MQTLKPSSSAGYDFLLYIRIDIYLKPYFDVIFDPFKQQIMFSHICCWVDDFVQGYAGRPRNSDLLQFWPGGMIEQFYPEWDNYWTLERLLHYFQLHESRVAFMLPSLHGQSSEEDWNPIYRIANRKESDVWRSAGFGVDYVNRRLCNLTEDYYQSKAAYEDYTTQIAAAYLTEGFQVTVKDDKLLFGFSLSSCVGKTNVSTGEWHNVALSYDVVSQTQTIMLDGVLDGFCQCTSPYSDTQYVKVGQDNHGNVWSGNIRNLFFINPGVSSRNPRGHAPSFSLPPEAGADLFPMKLPMADVLGLTNSSFTVLIEVNPSRYLLSNDSYTLVGSASGCRNCFFVNVSSGIVSFGWKAGRGSSTADDAKCVGRTRLIKTQWHSIGLVYDADQKTQVIYVDGDLDGNCSGMSPFLGERPLFLGAAMPLGRVRGFNVYSRALTLAQFPKGSLDSSVQVNPTMNIFPEYVSDANLVGVQDSSFTISADIYRSEDQDDQTEYAILGSSDTKNDAVGKCLLVLVGEAFRDGEHVGTPASVRGQKQAAQSHLRFLEQLEVNHDYRCDVAVNTFSTSYDDQLCSWYREGIRGNLVKCLFQGPPAESMPVDWVRGDGVMNDLMQDLKPSSSDGYEFLLYVRIDIYLKPYFDIIFDPNRKQIMFSGVCCNRDNFVEGEEHLPRPGDMLQFWPRELVDQYYPSWDNFWTLDRLLHVGQLSEVQVDFMLSSLHDADSDKDWNPIYRIVNRPESAIWHSEGLGVNTVLRQLQTLPASFYQTKEAYENYTSTATYLNVPTDGVALKIKGGKAIFELAIDECFGQTTIPKGEWHNVVFAYNIDQRTKSIYVDGNLDVSCPDGPPLRVASYLKVGEDSRRHSWRGQIRQVSISTPLVKR